MTLDSIRNSCDVFVATFIFNQHQQKIVQTSICQKLLLSMILLRPRFFGYCDVEMAEATHSAHPFVLGGNLEAVHARYPADAIIGPCQPCLRTCLVPNLPAIGQVANTRPAGLVSDSNSSPLDVCMPQNAHPPYYLVWARAPNIGRDIWVVAM